MDRKELVCAVCGYKWGSYWDGPERCPSDECRSLRWRDGKDRREAGSLIPVRVTDDERGQFERAAKAVGEGLVQWMLGLAQRAVRVPGVATVERDARKFAKIAAEKPVYRTPEPEFHETRKLVSFEEVEGARKIRQPYRAPVVGASASEMPPFAPVEMEGNGKAVPVVKPVVKKTAAELAASIPGVRSGAGGVVARKLAPQGRWFAELQRMAVIYNDAAAFQAEFDRLCPGLVKPPGWKEMRTLDRAAWLDENYPLGEELK